MLYLLAIVALVVGLVIGLVGFATAADPEGRGGNLVFLIYLGNTSDPHLRRDCSRH